MYSSAFGPFLTNERLGAGDNTIHRQLNVFFSIKLRLFLQEQATSTSMWLPVPDAAVPEPRPGSCVPDTRSLPDTVLNFIRKHPLMDGDVAHDGTHSPVFYSRDVTFTKIAVDQVVSTTSRR